MQIQPNPSLRPSYEASDLGNVRFCSDAQCTLPLDSWLEGCGASSPYGACSPASTSATFWVKLTSSIAGSGGTLTIYMAFLSTGADFDGSVAGESPTLTGTYGQFDNGANVFTLYDNFAGTSLSANWAAQASAGGSFTVNNGIKFTVGSGSDYSWIHTPSTYAYPLTDEADILTQSGSPYITVADSLAITLNAPYGEPYNGYDYDWYGGYVELDYNTVSNSLSSSYAVTSFNAGIWSFSWYATGHQAGTNGAKPLTDTNSGTPIGNYYLYLGIGKLAASNFAAQWYRARATPPNNVMPSVGFGSFIVNASAADAYVFSDSPSASSSFSRPAPDSFAFSDAALGFVTLPRALPDAFGFADNAAGSVALARAPFEAFTFLDDPLANAFSSRTSANAFPLTDSPTGFSGAFRSASDSASFADSTARVSQLIQAAADSFTFAESTGGRVMEHLHIFANVGDGFIFFDNAFHQSLFGRAPLDAFQMKDAVGRVILLLRSSADQALFLDSASRLSTVQRSIADLFQTIERLLGTTTPAGTTVSSSNSTSTASSGNAGQPGFALILSAWWLLLLLAAFVVAVLWERNRRERKNAPQ